MEEEDTSIGIEESSKSKEDAVNDEVDILSEELKSLWVEKYAPRKYTELLSEEVTSSLLALQKYKEIRRMSYIY